MRAFLPGGHTSHRCRTRTPNFGTDPIANEGLLFTLLSYDGVPRAHRNALLEIECLRSSLAMLPPQADGLSREDAMRLLAQLRRRWIGGFGICERV
jgi:hypothetical protein